MSRKNTKLRPYMAYDADPCEGALLVFAFTAREARRLAWPELNSWGAESYIGISTRAMSGLTFAAYLMTLATSDKPHVIDNPPTCERCERWGAPLNEHGCGFCGDKE